MTAKLSYGIMWYTINDTKLFIEFSEIVSIPVAGEVATGIPSVVNIEFDDFFYIPKEWIYSPKESFVLKVTGDSMNGIGVDKGDMVVLNRQADVVNGDIVIAIINEEVTLKRFMLMGDSILLLPENPKYEPIQMSREDAIINGKVIRVMKQ